MRVVEIALPAPTVHSPAPPHRRARLSDPLRIYRPMSNNTSRDVATQSIVGAGSKEYADGRLRLGRPEFSS